MVLRKTEDSDPISSYAFDEAQREFVKEKDSSVLDCSVSEIKEFFEGRISPRNCALYLTTAPSPLLYLVIFFFNNDHYYLRDPLATECIRVITHVGQRTERERENDGGVIIYN